jgi:hypothetical protein
VDLLQRNAACGYLGSGIGTDKKFPGNPTKSYRSQEPLRVVGEHLDWQGHTPEEIQAMKDFIADKEPVDD